MQGFSLHAAVRCEADDRQGLERLCRYTTRPALAYERVQCNAAGQVANSSSLVQCERRIAAIGKRSGRLGTNTAPSMGRPPSGCMQTTILFIHWITAAITLKNS